MRFRRFGLLASGLLASVATAADYWTRPELSGTDFDWTKATSYQVGFGDMSVPASDPTTGDWIYVHTNFSGRVVSGTASYNLLANCQHVKLQNGAKLEIEVSGADTTVDWCSPLNSRIDGGQETAKIVKCGAGALAFKSERALYSGVSIYDYAANIDVLGGTLLLPGGMASGDTYRLHYDLHVASGCTLVVGVNGSGTSGGFEEFRGIVSGEGLITNANASATVNLYVRGSQRSGYHSVFSGLIGGRICVRPYGSRLDLLNTANTFTAGVLCGSDTESRPGIIGAVDFGTTDGSPSSIGTSSSMTLGLYGGFSYLGTAAQTMSKTVYCNDYGNIIDGGRNGNFTFSYPRLADANTDMKNRWLVFSGSNEVDCIYSGAFTEQRIVSHRLIKDGPGTWLFKHASNRRNAGVIEVNDGTLKFETLAEAGTVCSLGLATSLYEKYYGNADDSRRVGYAFQLGGAKTIGTMEYVGESDVVCTTRKFALAGDGRIRASAGALDLDGFGTLNGASATLRLAGTGTKNVARNLTNDAGRVTLVKEDFGTWTLDDAITFKGAVFVKGGNLVVRRPDHYSWYRLILKENYYTYTNSLPDVSFEPSAAWLKKYFEFGEIGLFDAEGNRCNLNLTKDTNFRSTKTLEPRSYGYMNYDGSATTDGRTWGTFFDDKGYETAPQISSGYEPVTTSSNTWPMVVMRLSDDAPVVTSYDLATSAGIGNGDTDWAASPCSWELQGSLDGRTWVSLSEVTHRTPSNWHHNWYKAYDGTTAYAPKKNEKHIGFAFEQVTPKDVFTGVDTVGVASGATILTTDDVTINGLSVDATGAGTIDGFKFAANGVLNVENAPSGSFVLPGIYRNAGGFANIANWSVSIGGKPNPRRSIAISSEGEIRIETLGMTVIVR